MGPGTRRGKNLKKKTKHKNKNQKKTRQTTWPYWSRGLTVGPPTPVKMKEQRPGPSLEGGGGSPLCVCGPALGGPFPLSHHPTSALAVKCTRISNGLFSDPMPSQQGNWLYAKIPRVKQVVNTKYRFYTDHQREKRRIKKKKTDLGEALSALWPGA